MLSFIVPAYNEELELPSTLSAIRAAAAANSEPYEVIVVDDASTDATAQIAKSAGAVVVPVHYRQIAAVRNAGARAARGDVFFFVDADTFISPAHVTGARAALAAGCAGGGARVTTDGSVPLWGRVFVHVFSAFYFTAANLGAGAFLFTTRENFEAAGGFDEQLFAGRRGLFYHGSEEARTFPPARRSGGDLGKEVANAFRAARFGPVGGNYSPGKTGSSIARQAGSLV